MFVLLDSLLNRVIHLHGLLQAKEMIRPPMAGQLCGDVGFTGSAARIPQRGEALWIAFAGEDRAHDRHPGGAVQVGHCPMDADIHLIEAFLHPTQPVTPFRHERPFVPHQGAQQADCLTRPKRAAQQAAAV